jgi:membrane-bound inhibitor of C-type lysozyme
MTKTRAVLAFASLVLIAPTLALAQTDEVAPVEPAPIFPSASASLNLTIESAGDIERNIAIYQCDSGETISVQYINAAPNFLAIVPVQGSQYIFATTISGSGSRYVSGPYEWWSHQGDGTLRDLMQDEDSEPLLSCTQANHTP